MNYSDTDDAADASGGDYSAEQQ